MLRNSECVWRVNEHLGQNEKIDSQLTTYRGLGVSGAIATGYSRKKNKKSKISSILLL